MEIYQTSKPWGTYEVLLDDKLTKVKRITVYPGHRLSLQSHEHRQEQWTIIEGKLTVVLGDEQLIFYPGESVHIPLGAKHRAWNKGDEITPFHRHSNPPQSTKYILNHVRKRARPQ
jgi:mannose-6-phosphate isomerase